METARLRALRGIERKDETDSTSKTASPTGRGVSSGGKEPNSEKTTFCVEPTKIYKPAHLNPGALKQTTETQQSTMKTYCSLITGGAGTNSPKVNRVENHKNKSKEKKAMAVRRFGRTIAICAFAVLMGMHSNCHAWPSWKEAYAISCTIAGASTVVVPVVGVALIGLQGTILVSAAKINTGGNPEGPEVHPIEFSGLGPTQPSTTVIEAMLALMPPDVTPSGTPAEVHFIEKCNVVIALGRTLRGETSSAAIRSNLTQISIALEEAAIAYDATGLGQAITQTDINNFKADCADGTGPAREDEYLIASGLTEAQRVALTLHLSSVPVNLSGPSLPVSTMLHNAARILSPGSGVPTWVQCHTDLQVCVGQINVSGSALPYTMTGSSAFAYVEGFTDSATTRSVTWTNLAMQGTIGTSDTITATLDPFRTSTGMVLSAGSTEFPATATMSFFFRMEAGGITLLSDSPAVFQGTIHSIPPAPGDILTLINGPVAFHPEGVPGQTNATLTESTVRFRSTITIPIVAGYNLIANQLDTGNNTLNEIMPNVPAGSRLYKFDNASQSWQAARISGVGGWDEPGLTLSPGEGAWLQSPTDFSLTFTGNPHVPVLPLTLSPGRCYLLSRQTNDVGTYGNITGTTPEPFTTVYRFINPQGFSIHTFDPDLGGWDPAEPMANVGESLWICPSGGTPPPPPTCMSFAGLQHCSLGSAALNVAVNQLEVSNIGTSGADGVIISGGEAQGISAQIQHLRFDTNSSLRATARGTLNGTPNLLVGTLQLAQVGTNVALSADFTPLGSTSFTVEVWSGGVIVSRHTNVVGQLATIGEPVGPRPSWLWILIRIIIATGVLSPKPAYMSVDLGSPHPIILGAGLWTGIGSEIRVLAENQSSPRPLMQSLSLQGTSLSPIIITDETLKMFDLDHRALGQGTFQAQAGRLTVNNLGSSGEDGVSIALGQARAFSMNWQELDPIGTIPDGASLRISAKGRFGAVGDYELGSVRFEDVGSQLRVTADYSPIGTTSQRLEVRNNGQLIATVTNHTGTVAFVSSWPTGCGKRTIFPPFFPWLCYFLSWTQSIAITIPGEPTVMGDQLSIIAENGSESVSYLSNFAIQAAAIPSINIIDETVESLPPPVLNAALSAGNLTISWAGGGVLQQSSDLMNWSDISGAVSPYSVMTISQRKFYRVR